MTTTPSMTSPSTTLAGSDGLESKPISSSELRQLLAEDPHMRVLDVRTGAEFETMHIPGSFNVPLDLLAEHVRDVADLDSTVVLVCQTGQRASTAQTKLNGAGKTNLRVLDGGMGAWEKAGGEVVRGEEKWSLERQVRGVAGGIVLGSILTSIAYPKARFVAGGIGSGLLYSAVSNTCTMGTMLAKLPYNRGPACDLDAVLREMGDDGSRSR